MTGARNQHVPARPKIAAVVALPAPVPDAELVEGVRAGDPEAGGALFDRHHAHVRRVLSHVLGPRPELDDLVQDVFLEALAAIDKLENPSALRAWLGSIAAVTARSWLRKRARKRWLLLVPPEELPETGGSEQVPEASQAVSATYRVLERMPVDERVVFALRFVSGMDIAEVAEGAGVSLSTAKRRIARAHERFRKLARREPSLASWLEGASARERGAGGAP